MARKNNKSQQNKNAKPQEFEDAPARNEQVPDLLTFDDAAEESEEPIVASAQDEPRLSAMEDYMEDFQAGFGAAADCESEDEAEQAQAEKDEFARVTTMGFGKTAGVAEESAETAGGNGATASDHAKADAYQSPYAMQNGEQDLLTVGVTTNSDEEKDHVVAARSHDRVDTQNTRTPVSSQTRPATTPQDEIAATIARALELYAEDKIIVAGDVLLQKISQELLHERYCRENPKVAELMNRYYVVWTARRTMDAINMRRHQQGVEEEKTAEYNRVRKEVADKQWRQESWFSPQAYSWFKENEEMEASPARSTKVHEPLEESPDRKSRVAFDESQDSDSDELSGTMSDANARKNAKQSRYPTKASGLEGAAAAGGSPTASPASPSTTTQQQNFTMDPQTFTSTDGTPDGEQSPLSMQMGTRHVQEVDLDKYSTWDLQPEHEGVRVAISPDLRYKDPTDESSRIYSSVVEGKVDIEFLPLLSMLNEVDLYPAWMEGMMGGKIAKVEVIERVSRSNFVVRMLFNMSWPMANRKLVFRVVGCDCLNAEDQVKQFAVILEDVSLKEERQILSRNPYWDVAHDKPYEGSIRARIQNSSILITPSGIPGQTWVQAYTSLIPRMRSTPQWMVDSGHKNSAFHFIQMLRDARKVTKQAIYRDRQMDPNNLFYSWMKQRTRQALPFERCPQSVSMGGLSAEDINDVRDLVQKAQDMNAEMTTTIDVNGKQVVVDKRVYVGGKGSEKNFGAASAHSVSGEKKIDKYEDLVDDDGDYINDKFGEGYTSSEDEAEGLLSGGAKKTEGAGWKKGSGGVVQAQKSPVSPSGRTLLEDAPGASSSGDVQKKKGTAADVDRKVQLVSNPARSVDMAWAMNYVKLERRVTVLNVREGMRVRRGLHWKYGDEDLGVTPAGGYGVIVKYDLEQQIAKVRWHVPAGWIFSEQKKIGKYRLGPVFFDLAIYEDDVQAAVTEMLHNQMDPLRETDEKTGADMQIKQ